MTYDISNATTEHADKVLRAAGSGLRNYSMPAVKHAILSAMMDALEEAYRAGVDRGVDEARKALGAWSSQ